MLWFPLPSVSSGSEDQAVLARAVGERGRYLSSGERLRVMLARALCQRPRVLLLDAVDTQLDEAGQDMLRHMLREFDGTVVLATRSRHWWPLADVVWQLRSGQLEVTKPARGPAAVVDRGLAQRRDQGT